MTMYDVIIRGGTVVDGTGAGRYVADVAVQGGQVAKIAPQIQEEALREIDAKGKIVSPGFIDYHSHSDGSILFGPDAYNYLEQGVTTEITGQCGSAPAPCYPGLIKEAGENLSEAQVEELTRICDNYQSFMDHVSKMELGNNIAFYIGQGSVRGRVMGYDDSQPTQQQLEEMKAWVRQAMECGYLGFTTGLVYAPSVYAGEAELVELAKVLKKYDALLTVHMRNEGPRIFQAVDEMIDITRRSGVHLQISHLKLMGKPQWGRSQELLDKIEAARQEGMTITCDQYPYTATSTSMTALLPKWAHDGGRAALLERLRDPSRQLKAEIAAEMEDRGGAGGGAEAVPGGHGGPRPGLLRRPGGLHLLLHR